MASGPSQRHLDGDELWGDDLDADGIASWFAAEEQAYREMKEARVAQGVQPKGHQYDAVNRLLAFDRLPPGRIGSALAVGGYDGSEMSPLFGRLDSVTVLDPAYGDAEQRTVGGITMSFEPPQPSGLMRFDDASFDLTTALSVLHHIPNVTTLLSEMVRVTRPGGHILIREPITSMGDFSQLRPGLTPNERGLPLGWLERTVKGLPVEVTARRLWRFPVTSVVVQKLGLTSPYNHRPVVLLDRLLSEMTRWNVHYRRTHRLQKLSPGAIFLTLVRR